MIGWFDIRPPRGGIAFLAFLFMVAGLFFLFVDGGSWYTRYVCPAFFPIGIGLWLKHSWARWIAFALFFLGALLMLFIMFRLGITMKSTLKLLMALGTLYSLWEWDVLPEGERMHDADFENDLTDDNPWRAG